MTIKLVFFLCMLKKYEGQKINCNHVLSLNINNYKVFDYSKYAEKICFLRVQEVLF